MSASNTHKTYVAMKKTHEQPSTNTAVGNARDNVPHLWISTLAFLANSLFATRLCTCAVDITLISTAHFLSECCYTTMTQKWVDVKETSTPTRITVKHTEKGG